MSQHHVRINMIASGKYSCTGAVCLPSTPTPIIDAALALRDAGHPDTDLIVAAWSRTRLANPADQRPDRHSRSLHRPVDCGEITVSPATIAAILRPRQTPGRNAVLREMLGLDPR